MEKNQTRLYVASEQIKNSGELLNTNRSTELLNQTQDSYRDADLEDRVKVSQELDQNTYEINDLLKAPEEELQDWQNKEPEVVEALAFASFVRETPSKSPSHDEREAMMENATRILNESLNRIDELYAELDSEDISNRRQSEINRNISYLSKAKNVIAIEIARKKELGLW